MQPVRTPPQEQSSQSTSSVERSAVSALRRDTMARAVSASWRYELPRERGLSWFLVVSAALFAMAVGLAGLIPTEEKLPPMIEVDLGFDGVENEPPPLGEPDAGVGEVQPEPPATEPEPETKPEAEMQPPVPEPMPEPVPEPEPEPMPEPEPVVEPAPMPEPVPQFEVPKEEPPPEPKPKPKPVQVQKPKPKPAPKPATVAQPRPAAPSSGAPAGSGLTTGRAGVRGSPGGRPGGRGGGRGDVISAPHPQYDATAKQRGYQGRGMFVIRYENGRIVSVTVYQSTGVPYLDSRTTAWIKSRWRVKSGTSGTASVPVTWKLR